MACATCNRHVNQGLEYPHIKQYDYSGLRGCKSGIVLDRGCNLGKKITGRSTPGQSIRIKPNGSYRYPAGQPPAQSTYTYVPSAKKLITWDWGTFVIGMVVGGIAVGLLVTQTGRSLLGAAGQRTTRYVRGY